MDKLIKDVFSVRTANYLNGCKYVKDIDINKLRGGAKTRKEVMDYIKDNEKITREVMEMVKNLSFVSGGMVVNADKMEYSGINGMYNLINDGVRVAAINMDISRLKILHLYKSDNYISVTYSVDYK